MLEWLLVTEAVTLAQIGALLHRPTRSCRSPSTTKLGSIGSPPHLEGSLTAASKRAIAARLEMGDLWGALRLHHAAPVETLGPSTPRRRRGTLACTCRRLRVSSDDASKTR